MSSKETILARIRENRSVEFKEFEPAVIKNYIKNGGDFYENFKTNLTNNKSIVYETTEAEIESKVAEILKNIKSQKLMFAKNLPFDVSKFEVETKVVFDKQVGEIYNELFECDTSIIKAKAGVVNLGVLCISSNDQPRLLSLLPTHCIVLVKKESLVESLPDAIEKASENGLPTNIIFIIGPSRTSDIELQTVLGVHGPQNVHVVLY